MTNSTETVDPEGAFLRESFGKTDSMLRAQGEVSKTKTTFLHETFAMAELSGRAGR